MADTDPLSAVLAEFRERNEQRIEFHRYTEYTVEHDVAEGDVRRLLAALDAVLKLHQPRQLYGMVETMHGRPLCDHSPDYDGDAHFEADDGIWYCKDKPTLKVCASCADGPDGDTWAEWPCSTVEAITRALTGEGKTDG